MEIKSRKNIRNISIIAVIMLFAFVCRVVAFNIDDFFIATLLVMIRNAMHISLAAVWTVSIYMRVVSKQIKSMLIAVGLLMIGWMVIRTCKIEFLYTTDTLTRYFWYAFYIPMILIPLIGVFITMHIGKSDDYKLPSLFRLFYMPAALVILLVFTNDFHRLVFDFPNGILYFNSDYTYGPLFFIPSGWFTVLGFYFVVKLLLKGKGPGNRMFQRVHIAIMAIAVVFWCLYAFTGIDADLTAVDCALITLLLESAIQSGLIRTSTNYRKLFEISSVTAQIADSNFNVCVRSSESEVFSSDILKSAVSSPQNLGDYILNAEKISGGYVYWQDDIKNITELIETLQETQKQLSENNFLLQAEYELKENKAKTEEKNRLFNKLIYEISPKLLKAEELLTLASSDEKNKRMHLAKLAVIGAYIKRRGNLFIISEDRKKIRSREIEFCINESLSNLRLLDIIPSFVFSLDEDISSEAAVKVYDIFEFFTEELLDTATALFVKISEKEDFISMRMMFGTKSPEAKILTDSEILSGADIIIENSDDDIIIDVLIPKEVM